MLILITSQNNTDGFITGQRLAASLNLPFHDFTNREKTGSTTVPHILSDTLPLSGPSAVVLTDEIFPLSTVGDSISVLLYSRSTKDGTDHTPVDSTSYDITLNTDCLGIAGSAELLSQLAASRMMRSRPRKLKLI